LRVYNKDGFGEAKFSTLPTSISALAALHLSDPMQITSQNITRYNEIDYLDT